MNLKRIRYFVAVAEELHFGRGAQRLNVVQPAVSQQIKLLEQDLGAHLFERSSRRVVLTPAGRAFLVEAKRVLEQVEIAAQAARDSVSGLVGALQIGFVDNAIWSSLPPLIREFRKRHSRIELVLSQMPRTPQLDLLDMGKLDLAIVPGPVLRPGVASLELARAPLYVALPRGHALTAKDRIAIEDLAREPFVALPAAENPRRINEVIHSLCADAGFVPILGQAVEQLHASLSLVSAGLGVGIVPHWLCRAWSDNIEYRQLVPETEYVLLLCYRDGRVNPMIGALLDVAREWLERSKADGPHAADARLRDRSAPSDLLDAPAEDATPNPAQPFHRLEDQEETP